MADVLVLTRRDGTTEIAHIGSPFLAVLFEDTFHKAPDTAGDNGWMAFYDIHDRPPNDHDELLSWLKQFIATDVAKLDPTGTVLPTNGTAPTPADSSPI
jgi:hypothetical protein